MRKQFLILVCIFSSVVISYGQAEFSLGVKGGMNLAEFDEPESYYKVAFHGGTFFLIKLGKIGIQPEILFSQQGGNFSRAYWRELTLNYLTIPFMIKVYVVGGLNVQAGPQISYLLSASAGDGNVDDNITNPDKSVNIGLGWDLPSSRLSVDARYNLGVVNLAFEDDEYKNYYKSRVIQISLGYKFSKPVK